MKGRFPTPQRHDDWWQWAESLVRVLVAFVNDIEAKIAALATTITDAALTVRDEGVDVETNTTIIDFVGAGVTATPIVGGVQVDIPGGGGGGSWTTVMKTADEGRTNNTIAMDSQLFFPTIATRNYRARLKVFFSSTAAADFQFYLRGDGGMVPGTWAARIAYSVAGAPSGTDNETVVTATGGYGLVTILGATTGYGWIDVEISFLAQSTNGNYGFYWAQNTTNVTPTVVLLGSYLEWMEIA